MGKGMTDERPDAVEVLATALYTVSQRHDWENTIDREDRTAKILAALPENWHLTPRLTDKERQALELGQRILDEKDGLLAEAMMMGRPLEQHSQLCPTWVRRIVPDYSACNCWVARDIRHEAIKGRAALLQSVQKGESDE